jgi:hypothetical protein
MSANTLLWGLSAILCFATAACGIYLQDSLVIATSLVAAASAGARCALTARQDRMGDSPTS